MFSSTIARDELHHLEMSMKLDEITNDGSSPMSDTHSLRSIEKGNHNRIRRALKLTSSATTIDDSDTDLETLENSTYFHSKLNEKQKTKAENVDTIDLLHSHQTIVIANNTDTILTSDEWNTSNNNDTSFIDKYRKKNNHIYRGLSSPTKDNFQSPSTSYFGTNFFNKNSCSDITDDEHSMQGVYRYCRCICCRNCHSATVTCLVICLGLVFSVLALIMFLLIMGNMDVRSSNLDPAQAQVNITIMTDGQKAMDLMFNNDTQEYITHQIRHAFFLATDIEHIKEFHDRVSVVINNIRPLFDQHMHKQTELLFNVNISSLLMMDHMLTAIMTEKNSQNLRKDPMFYYKANFVNTLARELNKTLKSPTTIWQITHEFSLEFVFFCTFVFNILFIFVEYPIVCTVKMKIGTMLRGKIIAGIKYSDHQLEAISKEKFKHEDVNPYQFFYVDDILGASFEVRSQFTHHRILCEMLERVSHYMDEELRENLKSFLILSVFKTSVDLETVRCCVAADGNIVHNLGRHQCVGYEGDRTCDMQKIT